MLCRNVSTFNPASEHAISMCLFSIVFCFLDKIKFVHLVWSCFIVANNVKGLVLR